MSQAPTLSEVPWQRLDPRTLIIAPLGMLKEMAIPAVVAIFGASRAGAGPLVWAAGTMALLLISGLASWLITRYRVTPTHLEIRRSFIGNTVKTTPIERIRTVDIESSLLHRLLGVTKVKVGTGTGGDGSLGLNDGQLALSALSHEQAQMLRGLLQHRAPVSSTEATPAGDAPMADTVLPTPPVQELSRLDWSWLRFAPFSLSRMVIVVSAIGALMQFGDDLPFLDWDHLSRASRAVLELALPVLGVLLLLGALVGWLIVSIGGYAVQWFGYRLTRGEGNLHRTSGLFTTKSITVEEARVRGAIFNETLLLRLVHGAEANVLASGLGVGGSTPVVPPAPRETALDVAQRVLGTSEPFEVVATRHGPASRRRSHTQAQWATVFAAGLAIIGWYVEWLAVWQSLAIVVAVAGLAAVLGESAYRHRGHGLTAAYLVADSGVTTRRRTVLQRDGIIGWAVHETFFQRRRGLCTLVATTACNQGKVEVRDLPKAWAERLAAQATPGILADFVSLG